MGFSYDDQSLLGWVTLETVGLILNPFGRAICRMRLLWRG